MSIQVILLLLAGAGLAGVALGYFLRLIITLGKRGSLELEIRKMRLDAEERAKKVIEEAEEKAKQKSDEIIGEHKERERELKTTEERLVRKEELLDKRQTNLDSEQATIEKKHEFLQTEKEKVVELVRSEQEKLEKVAGLSAAEAKAELVGSVEKQYETDLEGRMRKLEISGNERLENRAKEILTTAVHRP